MPPSLEIVDRFSTHLKNVLTRALCFVVENGQSSILAEHLLWALGTERGCIGAELLRKAGVAAEPLRALAQNAPLPPRKEEEIKQDPASPQLSEAAKRALEKAVLTANAHQHRYVGTEHLLAGLIAAHHAPLEAFFAESAVDTKTLGEQIVIALRSATRFPDLAAAAGGPEQQFSRAGEGPEPNAESRPQTLTAFGRELTAAEHQPKLDPVIGREREIERVMEILCRRTKNNPLLIGEPGVGKTAIVEGLAKRIHAGEVPPALRGKRIVCVDLAAMIAGTMYRGEFEQRIRQVIEEARKNPDVVLFIDELHTVVGAGASSGSLDAANILKPALARGELRCIGATTLTEFKKHIEPDAALERRFQSVIVDEPTPERALAILKGLAPAYEAHHHVNYSPEALETAVRLSVRFLQDRRLPDKAIDLMDEAAAARRVRSGQAGPVEERRQIESKLEAVRARKHEAVLQERFHDALALKDEESALERALAEVAEAPVSERPTVSAEEIMAVVARTTGLSLADVRTDSVDSAELERVLTERVVGQESAVRLVARAVARAKAGLGDARRPLASFLFVGPTGVGKTELAKALAVAAFRDPRALVRLDMSEYAEAFTASKLVGAPAGYVGYRDNAKLTDRVRQRPHTIVLFDEIEKAHPDIQSLLLQLLEEGELSDASGTPVSFRNAIIVLTSNVGSEHLRQGNIGFAGTGASTQIAGDLRRELEERFRPELLNRLDQTVAFAPLSADALRLVAERQIAELTARLALRGSALASDPEVAGHLAGRADPAFGARDIRRLIQTHIEERLADLIGSADAFRVRVTDQQVEVKPN